MALIVFLSLAWCGATGGHIAVDLLDRVLNRPSLRWLPALMSLVGGVLFAVIAWRVAAEAIYGWKQIGNMLRDWERQYPGRIESMFTALHNVVPSHLMDASLFDFQHLQATGTAYAGGDVAFDEEPRPEAAGGLSPLWI
mgnify:CR=1 FL=1